MKWMKTASRCVYGFAAVGSAAFFLAAATEPPGVPDFPRRIVHTAWTSIEPILERPAAVLQFGSTTVQELPQRTHAALSTATAQPAASAAAPSPSASSAPATGPASAPGNGTAAPAAPAEACGGACGAPS